MIVARESNWGNEGVVVKSEEATGGRKGFAGGRGLVVFCVSVCCCFLSSSSFLCCSVCRLVSSLLRETNMVLAPPPPSLPPRSARASVVLVPVPCPLSAFLVLASLPVLGVLPLRTALFAGERSPKNASCRGGGHVLREGPGRRPIRAKAARAGWPFRPPPQVVTPDVAPRRITPKTTPSHDRRQGPGRRPRRDVLRPRPAPPTTA